MAEWSQIDATWLVSVHVCFCICMLNSCVIYFAVNVIL